MRQERFNEPHKQGLERLTGDNTGLVYCNERTEVVTDERKTLAKVLKASGQYDSEDYAEFKAYNEFAEGI